MSKIDSRKSFISPQQIDRKSTGEILDTVRLESGGDYFMPGATKEHSGPKRVDYLKRRLGALTATALIVVGGTEVSKNADNIPVVSKVKEAAEWVSEPVADTISIIQDMSQPKNADDDHIEQFRYAVQILDPANPDENQRKLAEESAKDLLGPQP